MHCVDVLMHQNHMSQLLLIHTLILPNDLNILLLMDVVLNNVALTKFPSKIFMTFYNMNCYILTVCNCLSNSASHHVPCIEILLILCIHSMNSLACVAGVKRGGGRGGGREFGQKMEDQGGGGGKERLL